VLGVPQILGRGYHYDQEEPALTLHIAASRDLLNLGLHFDAVFEIIDATPDAVVRQVRPPPDCLLPSVAGDETSYHCTASR